MKRSFSFLLAAVALFALSCACQQRQKPLDAASLRGLSKDELKEMREEIVEGREGKPLSSRETARVEAIREQERRLENAWIFGEWQERHGARLIFRDDGSVSVGARGGFYDELGVYKFISPEEPSYESTWTLAYDTDGQPVAMVRSASGDWLLYPFHDSRKAVYEHTGDLLTAVPTGFYFKKNQ